MSEPIYPIHLRGIPTALLVAAKSQTDSIIRDLKLIQVTSEEPADPLTAAMTRLRRTLGGSFQPIHEQMKRQAWASLERAIY